MVLPMTVGTTAKVFSFELGQALARSLTTVDTARVEEVFFLGFPEPGRVFLALSPNPQRVHSCQGG